MRRAGAQGAQSAPAPLRAQADARSLEAQGFAIYCVSFLAYMIYLVWAFVPDAWLLALGIEWYPRREWAVLIPSWIIVAVGFTYVAYFSINMLRTPDLDDPASFADMYSAGERMHDVPLGAVNQVMFG